MDLFGKRRIAQLRDDLAQADEANSAAQARARDLEAKNRALANQVEYLVRTIRDMDGQIFQIGQLADGSWTRVRNNFANLHEGMMARKRAESDRVGAILSTEIIKAYAPDTTKRITK